MMDKERVAPNLFCYQIAIGICARNGYLTQAFDLYRGVIYSKIEILFYSYRT